MKRSVLLTIDDDRVADLEVRGKVGPFRLMKSWTVPVPPGDQLTRDLADVTAWILGYADEARDDTSRTLITRVAASACRIRAALGLDEEGTDE